MLVTSKSHPRRQESSQRTSRRNRLIDASGFRIATHEGSSFNFTQGGLTLSRRVKELSNPHFSPPFDQSKRLMPSGLREYIVPAPQQRRSLTCRITRLAVRRGRYTPIPRTCPHYNALRQERSLPRAHQSSGPSSPHGNRRNVTVRRTPNPSLERSRSPRTCTPSRPTLYKPDRKLACPLIPAAIGTSVPQLARPVA